MYIYNTPTKDKSPLRSTVVRASAGGAGGRGSIPDHVTPKMWKLGGLRFSAWGLALMRQPTGRFGVSINGQSDSFLLTCGRFESMAWHPKPIGRRLFGTHKTGPHKLCVKFAYIRSRFFFDVRNMKDLFDSVTPSTILLYVRAIELFFKMWLDILPWTLHSFDHNILFWWTHRVVYTCFGTVYDPFGVDVPLNFDITHSHAYTWKHHRIQLAVGYMTMSGWKPTISLIQSPPTPTKDR